MGPVLAILVVFGFEDSRTGWDSAADRASLCGWNYALPGDDPARCRIRGEPPRTAVSSGARREDHQVRRRNVAVRAGRTA
jgi:hypothetical protein